MTMYQFMVNAFYMLCGVACVAASVVIVYIVLNVLFRALRRGRREQWQILRSTKNCFCARGLGSATRSRHSLGGILEGVEDYTIEQAAREMQEEHDAQEAEEGLKRPVKKTLIGDCRKCWCDQCAKLEQCVHLREGALPDGVRPFPCVGCADGMRFKPCEEERCADFEQGAGFNNG